MNYQLVRVVWMLARAILGKRLVAGNNVEAIFTDPIPDGSFLLLSNHSHALDAYVVGALIGRPIRYMANIEGVSRLKASLSGLVGAFGKRKGMPDVTALRETIKYLRAGEPVGIFPEGDRSWDGRTAPIQDGVARLAKIAGVPLVLVNQRGSYLTYPRWAKARRSGRWIIEFRVVDATTVAATPLDELASRVRASLDNDDVAWATRHGVRFECSAPAAGASRALWACPSCGAAGSIVDDNATVRCQSCGEVWRVDATCGLRNASSRTGTSPADIPSWILWQRGYARDLLDRTAGNVVSLRVAGLSMLEPEPARAYGPGLLSVSRTGFAFVPDSGANHLSFEAAKIEGFVDNFNVYCAFTYGKERWRLDPGSSAPLLWIDLANAVRAYTAGTAEERPQTVVA